MFGRILIYSFLLIASSRVAHGQAYAFERNTEIIVENGGITLRNPWVGGLNAPHFSPIDINNDGKTDIFIFEKSGNKIYIFLNEGTENEIKFKHAPEYENYFPAINFWALLRDYNQDGKPDIFSSAGNGIKIHKNTSSGSQFPEFELVESLLNSNYNPQILNLFVSPVDLPAIDDIDGDGDLDILTFYILGTCVEYHKNLSVEQSGNSESLTYQLQTLNWGNFTENLLTNEVNLNDSCGSSGLTTETTRHSGTTLTTFDANNNGVKDLILGGIGYPVINFLENGGTVQNAHMISSTFNYPSSYPVHLESFPSTFFMDVNNDGKQDLIVSPNTVMESENKNGVQLYLNTSPDAVSQFDYQQNDFLQGEMLDFGQGAYPVFFDFDGDGDLDIAVGNAGYFTPNGLRGHVAVYRNVGSNLMPRYRLITDDLAQMSTLSLRFLVPTFGDLDGDGKQDMLVGTLQGNILFYKNISTSGDAVFELQTSQYKNINQGSYAAPQLFDIDRDGHLDLIIGNRSGKLSYFRNIGSSNQAHFSNIPETDFLGGVRTVKNNESNFGYAIPCFFRMNDITHLFCGSESGFLYAYTNIDNNLAGNFELSDSTLTGRRQGKFIGIAAYDLNNDGNPEMLVGNAAGGLVFFDGIASNGISTASTNYLNIYPNPNQGLMHWNCEACIGKVQIECYDITGRSIFKQSFEAHYGIISFSDAVQNGIYLLTITDSRNKSWVHKLFICK